MAGYLEALTHQNPLFHWQQVADVVPFGYDFYSPRSLKTVFLPISNANRVAVTSEGSLITMTHNIEINGVPQPDNDPTDPMAKKPGQVTTPAPAVAITLAAAIKPLNKQGKPEPLYQVDAALAAKRVMMVGAGEADGAKLMDAFADVYGLRVRHADNGALILTRLRDVAAPDIMSLGKALRGVTPAPLVRALHARIRAAQRPPLQVNEPLPPAPIVVDYDNAGSVLCLMAAREFRALAEPQVRTAKDKNLTLSKLGDWEKKLFAITRTINTLADVCWLAERPIPTYIADFDHVVLTGGPYQNSDGQTRYSLSLCYSNPITGEVRRCVGFFGATLAHHP